MAFSSRTLQALHEDHLRTLAVMARLQGMLRRHRIIDGRAPSDGEIAQLLGDLIGWAEEEIGPHFGLEDGELFPRLAEAGEGDLGDMLKLEHDHIVVLAGRVTGLAREARADGVTSERWAEFVRLGRDLADQVIAHVTKEEDGLLPVLDGLLTDDDDARIALAQCAPR